MGYKKLAHFQNGVSILGEMFFRRGANLESRAAHIHPQNTQVPPPRALSQQPMRPRAKWAIESEAIRGRGIIIYCFSKIQLVGQKYRDQSSLASKTRFSHRCFDFQIRCFLLVVGYNIQPSISSTNQNAAFIIDHQLDFTNINYCISTNEVPSELSCENMIPSHVKITCYCGCCLMMQISISLCCALKKKGYMYILISVYCNTEFGSLSSD